MGLAGFVRRQGAGVGYSGANRRLGAEVGTLRETMLQYQGSGRRSFLGDSEMYVDGGQSSTSSLLFTLPIDLATNYASANMRFTQRHRWKSMCARVFVQSGQPTAGAGAATLSTPGQIVAGGNCSRFRTDCQSELWTPSRRSTLTHGLGLYGARRRKHCLPRAREGLARLAIFHRVGADLTYA